MRALRRVAVVVVATPLFGIASLAPPIAARAAATGPICTRSWAGAVTGSWDDASKWMPMGKPKASDDVCIVHTGTYTVTVSHDVSVHGLTLGASTPHQFLRLAAPCGTELEADVTRPTVNVAAGGELVFDAPGKGCTASYNFFFAGSGAIVNTGRLSVRADVFSNANLTNSGVIAMHNGATWANDFGQTLQNQSAGALQFDLANPGEFVVDHVSLAGALRMVPSGSPPAVGKDIKLFADGNIAGHFAKYTGLALDANGLYLREVCGCNGGGSDYDLVVTRANLTAPSHGAPGSTLHLRGTAWPRRGPIALSFTDAHGTPTTYPSVTANSTGAFDTVVAVPAGAASGSGHFVAQSTTFAVQDTAAFFVP